MSQQMSFTDNQGLPLKEAFETLHPLEELTDAQCEEIKRKILEAGGDFSKTTITPRECRNLIYTLRRKQTALSPTSPGQVKTATNSAAKNTKQANIDLSAFLE